jgi:hypothetical protein
MEEVAEINHLKKKALKKKVLKVKMALETEKEMMHPKKEVEDQILPQLQIILLNKLKAEEKECK